MKLTIKQKRFADEYIISGNATQAAIKAGYSEKSANRIATENLSKLYIKAYIDSQLKELEDKQIAKRDEVHKYLTSVLRGQSKSEVMAVEFVGDGVSRARRLLKNPDEKERLKAAELLGKIYGLFSENVNLNADLDVNIKVDYGD